MRRTTRAALVRWGSTAVVAAVGALWIWSMHQGPVMETRLGQRRFYLALAMGAVGVETWSAETLGDSSGWAYSDQDAAKWEAFNAAVRKRRAAGTVWMASVTSKALFVPLWWVLAPVGVLACSSWARRWRVGGCRVCGYDRRGLNVRAPCPECGAVRDIWIR